MNTTQRETSQPTLAPCRPPDLRKAAAQMWPAVPDCGRDVMHARFKVATLSSRLSPRGEDACQVGTMRRIAAARLRYCGLEAMTDDVMLIVTELLTNALQHSGTTEINLIITVADGALRVRVQDGMPTPAAPRRPGPTAESGRGLLLIDAVARENGGTWGTSEAGAETWCCLPLPAQGQP